MDFFKRIGTDRHKFKLQFFIGKVKVSKKLKGEVSIAIKRGNDDNIQVIIRLIPKKS